MKKKEALRELATRHCPTRRPKLSYVKRIQIKQRELESNPEFQKDLAELKKKIGDDLNLNRFKRKKYIQAFRALNKFVIKWQLQGVREGRPIISALRVESDPERKAINLFIPAWILSQDIRDFLPRLEDFLKGEKIKWGTYTGTRRECEARNKKIKARFLYLTNRRGLKSGEAISILAEKFKKSESVIKQAIYPIHND